MRKTKLQKIIEENTVPASEVFKNLTPEQKKIVDEEIRRYDILMALRKMRKRQGLTQQELADRANIPRTTVTKIESGTYNPTVNTLMSIASAMNKKLEVKFV